MQDIIEKLFSEVYYPSAKPSPTYKKLCAQQEELWNQARPLLEKDAVEAIQNNQSDIEFTTNQEWFREGFRPGALLMLQLL